jgi:hypothetical protein
LLPHNVTEYQRNQELQPVGKPARSTPVSTELADLGLLISGLHQRAKRKESAGTTACS